MRPPQTRREAILLRRIKVYLLKMDQPRGTAPYSWPEALNIVYNMTNGPLRNSERFRMFLYCMRELGLPPSIAVILCRTFLDDRGRLALDVRPKAVRDTQALEHKLNNRIWTDKFLNPTQGYWDVLGGDFARHRPPLS